MTAESDKERIDRELIELLNELRVALPGVQVLFAFLLVVPFQQRFAKLTSFQQDVYFATLSCSALATILLIAPSAYHRLNFRIEDKSQIVLSSNRFAIAGLAALALAMTGVMLLISDFVFGTATAIAATGASGGLFLVAWAALPLRQRRRSRPRVTGRGR
jgi:hypothetical protein